MRARNGVIIPWRAGWFRPAAGGPMSGQKVGNVATEQRTIQDWVKGLAAIPAQDFTLE